MITCGETKLIQSVHKILETFSKEQIQSLIFQRKNEYCSHLQKTNFFSDISVELNNNVLSINVEENPIINAISFEGEKRANIKMLLQKF